MSTSVGTVYLVGAGPGDPGLFTVRGLDVLKRAQVVVYDRLVSGRIVAQAPTDAEMVYAGKGPKGHAMEQDEINRVLISKAHDGLMVVRLKGGDPFVFGRGGEEAEALAEAGVPFEVVPGITAAIAVPAYAGIPVTHRTMSSSFAVITGREDPSKEWPRIRWDKLAGGVGTLVILMGVESLGKTLTKLRDHGLPGDTPAATIEWGTAPRQRTVQGTLDDIERRAREAGLEAPAVTVVGQVASLRDRLRWFDNRPLFGKRVLVTRSRAQASDLSRRLETLGAEALEVPTIEICSPADWAPLDDAVGRLSEFDWIVFTSVNAVDSVFERILGAGLDARALAGTRLCAIGPATASALLHHCGPGRRSGRGRAGPLAGPPSPGRHCTRRSRTGPGGTGRHRRAGHRLPDRRAGGFAGVGSGRVGPTPGRPGDLYQLVDGGKPGAAAGRRGPGAAGAGYGRVHRAGDGPNGPAPGPESRHNGNRAYHPRAGRRHPGGVWRETGGLTWWRRSPRCA